MENRIEKSLRVLISNDDGINAPGINCLYKHIKKSHDAYVVAPSEERSTTGHSLSLDHPVRLHQMAGDEKMFHCTGFPADSILMGLGHVLKDKRPDVVVSGINRGANLSQDLYYSGTMAAAREAAFHMVPSIAVSLAIKKSGDFYHFDTAGEFIRRLLATQIHSIMPRLSMLNVNVPNIALDQIKGVKVTKMGFRYYSEKIDKKFDSRERSYYWICGHLEGFENFNGESDSEVVEQGYISVTPLGLLVDHAVDFTKVKTIIHELHNYPR
jgi:5'-nucleotidase